MYLILQLNNFKFTRWLAKMTLFVCFCLQLTYAAKQIPAPVQVTAVTDYTLLDEVLGGK